MVLTLQQINDLSISAFFKYFSPFTFSVSALPCRRSRGNNNSGPCKSPLPLVMQTTTPPPATPPGSRRVSSQARLSTPWYLPWFPCKPGSQWTEHQSRALKSQHGWCNRWQALRNCDHWKISRLFGLVWLRTAVHAVTEFCLSIWNNHVGPHDGILSTDAKWLPRNKWVYYSVKDGTLNGMLWISARNCQWPI